MTEPVKLDLAAIRARAEAAGKMPWNLRGVDHPFTTIALLDMVERLTQERDAFSIDVRETTSALIKLKKRIFELVDAAS